MIRATIFDLDGTLVQTERLKALSYARAAGELRPDAVDEDDVVEAFKDVVGRSREEVARTLLERFGLEEAARGRMEESGADEPWQAFVAVRLGFYEHMVRDPDVLRENRWPRSVELLHLARRAGCFTALATTSAREQVDRVLEALKLTRAFDAVSVREDVERTKPDPEVYLLTARKLGLPPAECLVLEDSPAGVRAGLAAGMEVIAIATPFTRRALADADLLPPDRVVDDPERVETMVRERLGLPCPDAPSGGPESDLQQRPTPGARGARSRARVRGPERKG